MILASATPVTLTLALGASIAYAASAAGAARIVGQTLPRVAVWLAWCLHGLLLAWGLWGSEPRFGFAPALSVTAWLVGLVYAIESYVFPQLKTPWLLSGAGSAAVLLALLFPGQYPACQRLGLAATALGSGIASYGLFAVAVRPRLAHDARRVTHAVGGQRQRRVATADPGATDISLCQPGIRLADARPCSRAFSLATSCMAPATPSSGITKPCSRCCPGLPLRC